MTIEEKITELITVYVSSTVHLLLWIRISYEP